MTAVTGREVLAVLRRPDLWVTALRTGARLATPGWWRHGPRRPLPPEEYLRFRSVTAHGGDGTAPATPSELVSYLEWCRDWPAATRRR